METPPAMPDGFLAEFLNAHRAKLSDPLQQQARQMWEKTADYPPLMRYALLATYPRLARTAPSPRRDGSWLIYTTSDTATDPFLGAPSLYQTQRIDARGAYHNWITPLTPPGEAHLATLQRALRVYEVLVKFVTDGLDIPIRARSESAFMLPKARVCDLFWHYFLGTDIDWEVWLADVHVHGRVDLGRFYGLLGQDGDPGRAAPATPAGEGGGPT